MQKVMIMRDLNETPFSSNNDAENVDSLDNHLNIDLEFNGLIIILNKDSRLINSDWDLYFKVTSYNQIIDLCRIYSDKKGPYLIDCQDTKLISLLADMFSVVFLEPNISNLLDSTGQTKIVSSSGTVVPKIREDDYKRIVDLINGPSKSVSDGSAEASSELLKVGIDNEDSEDIGED